MMTYDVSLPEGNVCCPSNPVIFLNVSIFHPFWEATQAESSTPETQVQLAFARHVLTGIEDGGLRFVDRSFLQNNLHSLRLTVCPWK